MTHHTLEWLHLAARLQPLQMHIILICTKFHYFWSIYIFCSYIVHVSMWRWGKQSTKYTAEIQKIYKDKYRDTAT